MDKNKGPHNLINMRFLSHFFDYLLTRDWRFGTLELTFKPVKSGMQFWDQNTIQCNGKVIDGRPITAAAKSDMLVLPRGATIAVA